MGLFTTKKVPIQDEDKLNNILYHITVKGIPSSGGNAIFNSNYCQNYCQYSIFKDVLKNPENR